MIPPLNWLVQIVCKDCGHTRQVVEPDTTREILRNSKGKRMRGVLVWIPNECPECRNLRLVKSP